MHPNGDNTPKLPIINRRGENYIEYLIISRNHYFKNVLSMVILHKVLS